MSQKLIVSFCLLLLSSLGFTQESFIKFFGSEDEDERVANFISDGKGNFHLTATKENSILIYNISDEGKLLGSQSIELADYSEITISDIANTSVDGELIVVGTVITEMGLINPIIMKYSLQDSSTHWMITNQDELRLLSIEKPDNENYFIISGILNPKTNGNSTDGCYIKVSSEGEVLSGPHQYGLDWDESFSEIFIPDPFTGSFYAMGRVAFNGAGTSNYRASVTKLDTSGEELWSTSLFDGYAASSRNYARTMTQVGDSLYVNAVKGTPFNSTYEFRLSLLSSNGNAIWTKEYQNLAGDPFRLWLSRRASDGLIFFGHDNTSSQPLVIFKIGFNGEFIWGKKIEVTNRLFSLNYSGCGCIPSEFLFIDENDDIYFALTATNTLLSNNQDIVFGKLNSEGGFNSNNCLNLTLTDISPTISEVSVNPTDFNLERLESATLGEETPNIIRREAPEGNPCEVSVEANDTFSICRGESVQIELHTNADNILWIGDNISELSCTSCFSPIASPNSSTTYQAVLSKNGCCEEDTVNVSVTVKPSSYYDFQGIEYTQDCDGSKVYFFHENDDFTIPPNATFYWVINNDTIYNDPNPSYIGDPGTYPAQLYVSHPDSCEFTWADDFEIYQPIENVMIADTFFCTGDSVRIALDTDPNLNYQWSNQATTPFTYFSNPGPQQVTITNGNDCSSTINFNITESERHNFTLPNDTTICWYDSLLVGPTPQPNTTYLWNTGETTSQLTAKDSIKYTLTSNTNGCINIDSITVAYHRQAGLRLPEDTVLCFGDSIRIGFADSKNHVWNTGATTDSIYAKKEQWYTLTLNDAYCTESDSIFVDTVTPPQFNLPNTGEICGTGATVTLGVTQFVAPYYSFAWSSGESTPQITASNPGKYFLTVTDTLCSSTDSVQVNFIDFQLADFPDTTLCNGLNTITFSLPNNNYDSFEWSTGNTADSEETFATPGTYFYTATLSTCNDTDFFDIQGQNPPTLDLGADQVLCEDQTAILTGTSNTTNPNAKYYWEDAPQLENPTRTISDTVSGDYILFLEDAYCMVSDTINLQFVAYPVIRLQDNYIFCENDSVEINPELNPAYQYAWSTGETSPSIYIKTIGNYRLDVSNQMCPAFKVFTVGEQLPPTLDIGGALTEVCGFDPITLGASVPNGKTYTWNTGETTPRISVSTPGEYYLTAFDSICTVSDTTHVIFYEEPDIEAINFTLEVCLQDSFNIILQCMNCNFQDTQSDTLQRWVSGNDSLVYTATTPDGCIFTYRALVLTQEDCPIDMYVPNAFSPNQDGFNDAFRPVSRYENANFTDYTFEIYNRWGQRIFVSESHTEGWDGTYKGERVNNGVYVWRLNYLLEGSYQPDELRGTVQVLD